MHLPGRPADDRILLGARQFVVPDLGRGVLELGLAGDEVVEEAFVVRLGLCHGVLQAVELERDAGVFFLVLLPVRFLLLKKIIGLVLQPSPCEVKERKIPSTIKSILHAIKDQKTSHASILIRSQKGE